MSILWNNVYEEFETYTHLASIKCLFLCFLVTVYVTKYKINCIILLDHTQDIAIKRAPNAPGTTNMYRLVLSNSIPMAISNGPAVYNTLLMVRGNFVMAISVTHIDVTDPRKSQKLRTLRFIIQYLYSSDLPPSQAW